MNADGNGVIYGLFLGSRISDTRSTTSLQCARSTGVFAVVADPRASR